MDKITYLAELAEGLARWVPERERQDILRYYAEYFEEAGRDREAEVVAELGDPWALSCRLAVEGGYVTQEKAASWTPRKKWPLVLIGTAVGLTVFSLVCGIGLLGFNIVRAVSSPVYGVTVDSVSEAFSFEEALLEGSDIAFVDGAFDSCLIDGEGLGAFRSIDVDISLGNIEVVAGDDYTLSVTRSEALLGNEPELEVRDGILRLRDGDLSPRVQVDNLDDLKNMFGVDRFAMDVTITVPEGADLDSVNVKTGLGDVVLYGLCAETVTVDTGMGDVECYSAWNVRSLGLSTGMGDVFLGMDEACGGLSIGIKTGMGNIDATLCGFEADYSYSLESGMGAVTVNGGYQNTKAERGNGAYKLEAASGMGDVSVYFTADP